METWLPVASEPLTLAGLWPFVGNCLWWGALFGFAWTLISSTMLGGPRSSS